MSSNRSQSSFPFLEIAFRSDISEGTLKVIELVGVPGEQSLNREYLIKDEIRLFFDDLIVKPLFRKSRHIPNCDFQILKIWLYDTESSNEERSYEIPEVDHRDLCISSKNSISKLKKIYILDNELKGEEYEQWKNICEKLCTGLFNNFIASPEPPDILTQNSLVKPFVELIDKFTGSLDQYNRWKKKIFFDALIIQVD